MTSSLHVTLLECIGPPRSRNVPSGVCEPERGSEAVWVVVVIWVWERTLEEERTVGGTEECSRSEGIILLQGDVCVYSRLYLT